MEASAGAPPRPEEITSRLDQLTQQLMAATNRLIDREIFQENTTNGIVGEDFVFLDSVLRVRAWSFCFRENDRRDFRSYELTFDALLTVLGRHCVWLCLKAVVEPGHGVSRPATLSHAVVSNIPSCSKQSGLHVVYLYTSSSRFSYWCFMLC